MRSRYSPPLAPVLRDLALASDIDMLTDFAPPSQLDACASVHQLDAEDAALGQALRAMAWDAYLAAGRPLGPGEDAMWAWWTYGQGTTVQ